MVASTAPLLERSTHSMTSYSMVGNMVLKSIMAWLNSSRLICRFGLLLLSCPEVEFPLPPPSVPPFLEPPLLLRLNKLVISPVVPLPFTEQIHSSGFYFAVVFIHSVYHSNMAIVSKKHNLNVECTSIHFGIQSHTELSTYVVLLWWLMSVCFKEHPIDSSQHEMNCWPS